MLLGRLVPGLLALSLGCTASNPEFCGANCAETAADLRGPADDLPAPRADLPAPLDQRPGPRPDLVQLCRSADDCPSGVCLPAGRCAAADDVIYVDNDDGRCRGLHAGTPADPVCTLGAALDLLRAARKELVHVAGSAAPYDSPALHGVRASFFGPGRAAARLAQLPGPLSVQGASVVLFDGFDFPGVGRGDSIVLCAAESGAVPELTLLRSRVHEASGAGVQAHHCRLTVDRSLVDSNFRAGVAVDGDGDLLVVNSFLYYNGDIGVRVQGGTARVRFSTLAQNGAAGAAGAMDCAGGTGRSIEESIVVRNGRPIVGSQVAGKCRLDRSAIDEASYAGGTDDRFHAKPDFVAPDADDFHLLRTPGSAACCIDQLDRSDVFVDADDTPRPQGRRWDLGAHEIR